ncbi:MAG TPA: hypothetical protein PLT82_01450 [Candidatus Hydrogenedens sp.]|nr:hypothetical protein [Candidatus Hydrogenedens sp.]HOK08556.1 hypothetical protein [Candidatus Hydrogenedens sp.]HOL19044.1 hypothetical protein [Candidatus Hydrogenedens sp.]HPP57774.1 hypothetical protein [Candidatus Hydrogenedens sp.]
MKKYMITLTFIAILFFLNQTLTAQPGPMEPAPQGPPPNFPPDERGHFPGPGYINPPPLGEDVPAKEMLEQIVLAKIAKQLRLNNEQTVILVRKYEEQRDILAEMTKKRNDLANEIRKSIREKSGNLEEKFNTLVKLDKEIQEQKYKLVENLSLDLPLESKIQLYLLFSDFENEIKRFLKKAYEWKQERMPYDNQRPAQLRRGREQPPPSPKMPESQ